MSAEDPWRWAELLLVGEKMPREEALRRMVAGGVEAGLATEILDSIERNRPRPRPLRMAFGLIAVAAGVAMVLLMKAKLAAILIVGGLFWLVDGFRGKR